LIDQELLIDQSFIDQPVGWALPTKPLLHGIRDMACQLFLGKGCIDQEPIDQSLI